MWQAGLSGFGLGFSLIAAIGAQNVFVLRQGLRGEHVLAVCLTCALSDALLLSLGVLGFGALVEALPGVTGWLRYAGALFLLIYGARSLAGALRGGQKLTLAPGRGQGQGASLFATLGVCLALTWLNPHVYLDTVILMGSVAGGLDQGRGAFLAGAILASLTFFMSLGAGARLLRPLFERPGAWRLLDTLSGLLMWAIAAGLLLSAD